MTPARVTWSFVFCLLLEAYDRYSVWPDRGQWYGLFQNQIQIGKSALLIWILSTAAYVLREEETGVPRNMLSVACPHVHEPSALSYPEAIIRKEGLEVRVMSAWLWDRTRPCVQRDAGNVSIANL